MISLSKQYLCVACIVAAASSFSYGWLTTPSPSTRSPACMFVGSTTRLHEGQDSLADKSPREVAYDAADAVAEKAEDAKEKVDEDRAWDDKSVYEKAKNKTIDAKNYVKDKAVDAKDYVKDTAVDAKDYVKNKTVAVKDALVGDDED